MKRQHLLRVDRPAEEFAGLIAAMAEAGERVGYLELKPAAGVPAGVPESLEGAAASGVLRAVAVGGGRSLALKPLRGEPVLRDLLREHFRGCRLVLVRGDVDALRIVPEGDGWLLSDTSGPARTLSTEGLLAVLRKPSIRKRER